MERIIYRTAVILAVSIIQIMPINSLRAQGKAEQELNELRKKKEESDTRIFAVARRELAAFHAERPTNCGSEHLKKAAQFAAHVIREGARRNLGDQFVLRAGIEYLDVADAAKKVRCQSVARSIYDDVMRAFIAPVHAPLRQRAQIGIDDLRR